MTEPSLPALPEAALTVSDERVRAEAMALFLLHWRSSLTALTVLTVGAAYLAQGQFLPHAAAIWCALACCNYLGQAWVTWQLERAPSLIDVLPRWMPWLVASVACSGIVWGVVPWLLSDPKGHAQLLASLFDLCLLFAVVSSSATPAMALAGAAPVALLVSSAMLTHPASWLRLTGAILTGVFALVSWYGVRVQSAIHEAMRQSLLARDLAKALQQQQQRLVAVERERTLLLERQRLMRDMHDGLGSTLSSSLAAVEHGSMHTDEVATMLRDCMDDLRAVIDSLEPIDHDLVALLAMLRFRLGRRLDAAGMALDWHMGDLPPLAWLGPSEALQVMRIVQEALANSVKHARATRVRIEATCEDHAVQVSITDDGCGFDGSARHEGRGLGLLAKRAQFLGGSVAIHAQPGAGTRIELRLPHQR